LTGRSAPDRFFWNPPVVSNYAPVGWRTEFVRDLQTRPPRLILLRHGDDSTWMGGSPGDSCALFRGSPPLETLLESRYHFDRDDGGFAYFARNDIGVAPLKPS
jgi:hypothetical protein